LSYLITIPPPPTTTLFPYTTLFRSSSADGKAQAAVVRRSWRKAKRSWRGGCRPFGPAGRKVPQGRSQSSAQRRFWRKKQSSHVRSEEHTSELQSRGHLVCRLLLEKK